MSTTERAREQTRQRVEGFHIGCKIAREHVKGWSQKRLAEEATIIAKAAGDPKGVSLATVAMIESRERNPSLEMAGWLAEALGFKVEELCLLREPVAS